MARGQATEGRDLVLGTRCSFLDIECSGVCAFMSTLVGAPLGVILLRMSGDSILFINPRAREYLAAMRIPENASAIREALLDDHDLSRARPEWHEVAAAGRSYECSDYFLDAGQIIFVADVTDRKRYESIAIRADMESNTARLLSTVRHEMGNPVNTLKMALSVLGGSYDVFSDDKRRAYLEQCRKQVGALEEMLGLLRSFHAVDSVEPVPLLLSAALKNFAWLFAESARERGVEFVMEQCSDDCIVLGHPRALQQVLSNVAANALEAVEDGVGARIVMGIEEGAQYVTVALQDNGHGISADALANVFTPLFTTKEHGTGLGLPVVQQLMLRMRGDIEIESTVGKGTAVRLILARAGASLGGLLSMEGADEMESA